MIFLVPLNISTLLILFILCSTKNGPIIKCKTENRAGCIRRQKTRPQKSGKNILMSVTFNVFICKIIAKPTLFRAKKMVVNVNRTEYSSIYHLLILYLGPSF